MSGSRPHRDWQLYELRFPPDLSAPAVLGLLRSLATRPAPSHPSISFETVGQGHSTTGSRVRWFVAASPAQAPSLARLIRIYLPEVEMVGFTDDGARPAGSQARAIELISADPDRRLRIDLPAEASLRVLASLTNLRADEQVRIQWLIGRGQPRAAVRVPARDATESFTSRIGITRRPMPPTDSEHAARLREKRSEPVVSCMGRIEVIAATPDRAENLLRTAFGAIRHIDQPGAGLRIRRWGRRGASRRAQERRVPWWQTPIVLNVEELLSLLSWPLDGPTVLGVRYLESRTLPPPPVAAMPATSALPSGRRSYGFATAATAEGPVLVTQHVTDALSHRHILGPTGVGKSTLLANLILQDVGDGQGVVVIEPKGDLIADLLSRIPEERRRDVVLIEPTADGPSVGLPLLNSPPTEHELLVDQMIHVLRGVFASSWGPRTQDVLTASLLTLLRSGEACSLVDLPLLLTNARFRHRLTRQASDPLVLGPFWNWFESISDAHRTEVIGPVLNKLRSFLYRDSLRRLVGQPTGVNLESVFDPERPAIILVNLSRGLMGAEAANLTGALIVAALWRITQRRTLVAPHRRQPVGIYLDEFQDVVHLPTDLGQVLAQARGLGVGLTLAHQHLAQLTPDLRSAVLANARTKFVFGLGAEDARSMAPVMGGGLEAGDLTALSPRHGYLALAQGGGVASPCSVRTQALGPADDQAGRALRRTVLEIHGKQPSEVDRLIAERLGARTPSVPEVGLRRRREREEQA